MIVTVNLLSKQYCAFKWNTSILILNYESVTKVFGKVKNLCSNKFKKSEKKFYKKTSAIIDTSVPSESKSKSGSTNHTKRFQLGWTLSLITFDTQQT